MKLLFVNGCISQRGEESRTLALASIVFGRMAGQASGGRGGGLVEPEVLLALKPFAPEMLNERDALAADPVLRCAGV